MHFPKSMVYAAHVRFPFCSPEKEDLCAVYAADLSYPRMEYACDAAGCVFLLAAGYRYDSGFDCVGDRGYYWSSTLSSSDKAYRLNFDSSDAGMNFDGNRNYGQSVRLVCEE